MRYWTLAAVLTAACTWSPDGRAEVRFGIGQWRYDLAGRVDDRGRVYDFERDLDLRAGGKRSVLLEVDTGPGWWPDLTASFTQLGASGHRQETFTLFDEVLGVPIGTDTRTITADVDFDDFDLAAQYPFELGATRWSAGLVAKRLRGSLRIQDTREDEAIVEEYDETIPELRLQLRWPATSWLTVVGLYQGIRYQDSGASEWRAAAELRWRALLVEAGWQVKSYDIDVEDYALDADIEGLLVRGGLVWR